MKTSINQSKIQLLIVNIQFILYEVPDGIFKQLTMLAFFVLLWFNLKKNLVEKVNICNQQLNFRQNN